MEIDSTADNTTSTLPSVAENSANLTSNNSSQQQLTEKDVRIQDLQDYQQQMQAQNLHLSEKITAMTDQISDLLENQKASQLEASSGNESKEARIQTLIEQQSTMQQQNAVLTAEVTGLTNQTTDLLKNLQAAQNTSLTSEKDAHISKLMDQQERMQQQVSELIKDNQKVQLKATSQAAEKDAHIEELLERQGQMQQQISELMARLDSNYQNSTSVPTAALQQNSNVPSADTSHQQLPCIEISSVEMKAPPRKSNNNSILSRSRSKSLIGRESDMAAQLLGSFSPYGDRSETPGKSRGRSPRRNLKSK